MSKKTILFATLFATSLFAANIDFQMAEKNDRYWRKSFNNRIYRQCYKKIKGLQLDSWFLHD